LSATGGREIERVWVLRAMPAIPAGAAVELWEIEQGYLAPEAASEAELARLGFPEGRLRRVVEPTGAERFFHTVKRGAGVVREEIEREITRAEFDAAWPHTRGRRLAKTRHRVREGGLVWEVDLFRDLRAGDAPLVIVREVSEDARYRNSALAMYGVPA